MKKKKKDLWSVIAGVISIGVILWLWTADGVGGAFSTLPREELIPLVITSFLVSLLKVALLALAVWVIKWLSAKFKNSKKKN